MTDIKKIVYDCRKATLLIEKKQLTPLTLQEKIELKLHLAGCSICRTFQRQSIFINKQIRNLLRNSASPSSQLDNKFKESLQQRIKEKLPRP